MDCHLDIAPFLASWADLGLAHDVSARSLKSDLSPKNAIPRWEERRRIHGPDVTGWSIVCCCYYHCECDRPHVSHGQEHTGQSLVSCFSLSASCSQSVCSASRCWLKPSPRHFHTASSAQSLSCRSAPRMAADPTSCFHLHAPTSSNPTCTAR